MCPCSLSSKSIGTSRYRLASTNITGFEKVFTYVRLLDLGVENLRDLLKIVIFIQNDIAYIIKKLVEK